MSKPVRQSVITTMEGLKGEVSALFDTGSFLSLIREDKLPEGTLVLRLKEPKMFGTADTGGQFTATSAVELEVHVENHDIFVPAFVAPNLSAEMIIGAGVMQMWDITIKNDNGQTTIHIGRDVNDPDTQSVL